MSEKAILTKKHAYWRGFTTRLYNTLNEHNAKCFHDLRHTRKILVSLPDIDVEGSINYLESKGGFCDCEVLMNVC